MPLALDMQELTNSVWGTFQDSSGKILDEYSVKKWTFYKVSHSYIVTNHTSSVLMPQGVIAESRAEVWKFLLGYYPFLSTREQRVQIDREKK